MKIEGNGSTIQVAVKTCVPRIALFVAVTLLVLATETSLTQWHYNRHCGAGIGCCLLYTSV